MQDRNVGEPNKVQLEDAHNPYNDSVDSGLEVVAPSYSQLPVVVEDYTQLYSIASEQLNEKIIQSEQEKDTEKIAYHADDKFLVTKKKWHISRRRVHLAMAVLILVIAAIIGTVVGVVVQRRHSSGSGASGNGGSKQADHDNLVWSQTSLAVTGWRHADGAAFSIRLFYQDADGFIRMSNMESTSADSWTSGTKVAKAKRGTPLAAACTNQSTYTPGKTVSEYAIFVVARDTNVHQAMETHVFYLDETSQLREHVFRDDDLTGFSGPLSAQNITPASDTRLAAYWPSVTYQNADLTFSEARFNCTRTSTNCWDTTNLKIAGPGPSAAIGLIPMGTNHFGMWMFYQREDADLVNSAWNNASTAWGRSRSCLLLSTTCLLTCASQGTLIFCFHGPILSPCSRCPALLMVLCSTSTFSIRILMRAISHGCGGRGASGMERPRTRH